MDLRQRIGRMTGAVPPPSGSDRILYHGARIGLVLALAVLTYALFPASPAVESPIYEVGAVATENVIAPFAFRVRKSPAELAKERDELARSAKPILVQSRAGLDSSLSQLDGLFRAIDDAAAGEPRGAAARIRDAARARGVSLTDAEAEYLTFAGRRPAMRDALERVYRRWLSSGIAASGALDEIDGEVIVRRGDEERSMLADSVQTFANLLARARRLHPDPNSSVGDGLYMKLLSANFHPTIVADRAATERRRQELRASVSEFRYEVREGEKIIGGHEVVGRAEHDKLRTLQEEMQRRAGGRRAPGRVLGAVLYNALVLTIFGITLVLFRPQLYRAYRSLVLFALLFLLVIAGAWLVARLLPTVRPELVPIALAAIICSILFDPRISMIAAMILAVLVGGQSVFRGTNALFINLIGGAAAAISVQVMRRRDQIYLSVLTIFVAYALAAGALGLTLDWRPSQIGISALYGLLNAVGSVAVAMLLLPLAERFTGITTDLTLLEHSDLNRPLLRRLMLEAPGTFDHTMRMANLVEAACSAIGANGLLGRVGTYYHDIGKLAKPQFFVENQPKGRNPHDKLKPVASAQIIRSHVREGLELAEQYRLPRAIAAFVPEHHGTLPISYFLEKARERDSGTPNLAEYAYPGPIPQSQETAVCMLADGVEASARVVQEPTPDRIREVIDHIVKLRMEQGQLRDAPLTLRQLEIIKDQFARVLVGNYHSRIEYPARSGGVTSEFASA